MEKKAEKLTTVIVGFYDVPEHGQDSVETEVQGTPREQYAALDQKIIARHPKQRGKIQRIGSVIEMRGPGVNKYIEKPPGTTVGQLFEDAPGDVEETSIILGRVFINGGPNDVVLVNQRAAGTVAVQLNPVLKSMGLGTLRFANRISPLTLATELERLVPEIIGREARDLVLRFREVTPKPIDA